MRGCSRPNPSAIASARSNRARASSSLPRSTGYRPAGLMTRYRPAVLRSFTDSGVFKPRFLTSAAQTKAWGTNSSQTAQFGNLISRNARLTARTARPAQSRCILSSIPSRSTDCTRRWIIKVRDSGSRCSRERRCAALIIAVNAYRLEHAGPSRSPSSGALRGKFPLALASSCATRGRMHKIGG